MATESIDANRLVRRVGWLAGIGGAVGSAVVAIIAAISGSNALNSISNSLKGIQRDTNSLQTLRMIAIPSDTPVSVAGGSIIAKSFNPSNPSVIWSPVNPTGTPIGWQTPAATFKDYMWLSVEYSDFGYASMTRPWQIHFTFREGGAYQDSGGIAEDRRRGVKLCSDLNRAKDNCLPVGQTADLTDNNIYLFPLNNGFGDSIGKAAVDDSQPNGVPPLQPPYHRVAFTAGSSCTHCNHISDVILKESVGGQVSACRVKCQNSQCMVYTHKAPSSTPPVPNPIQWDNTSNCLLLSPTK